MAKLRYKVTNLFPEQVAEIERFNPADVALFGDFKVNNFFKPSKHVIELHVYGQDKSLIKSDYRYTGYSFLQTSAGAGKSGESAIYLDPVQDCIDIGFPSGEVNLVYNFINNLFSDRNNNPEFYIQDISKDRTELRLLTTQLSDTLIEEVSVNIKSALEADSYFSDFRLNFRDNNLVIATNISTEVFRGQQAVLIKLYEPLPAQFRKKDNLAIVEIISDSKAFEITSDPIIEPIPAVQLAGPNFDIEVEDTQGTPSPYFNLNDLFSYPVSSSYYELMSLANESGSAVSIDHTDYSDFVHFGSAEERLRNFKYKLQLIESYSGSIATIKAQNSSVPDITGSIEHYEGLITGIVNNFDHYDRFLYYESGSYSWPKSDSTRPYTNLTSSDASTDTWFTDNIASASNYDASNFNALTNALPAFIREDSQNDQALTFIYMLGQHFDNIWIYQKALSDKYDADNRLDFGISRDLVGEALKSFGVKLYSSNETLENLFSYFTGQTYPSGSSLASATHVTASSGVNAYLQPMPKKSYIQEVYKRIYHNLPFLTKSKGTERGLRALLNCYGIPSDILSIRTEGNIRDDVYPYLSPDEHITGSLNLLSSSLDNITIDLTGSAASGDTLSRHASVYRKSPFRVTRPRHIVEVAFSPADQENIQIYNSASDAAVPFSIDDYIGAPTDSYSTEYTGLKGILADYTGNNSRYNIKDFVSLIRFFDNTLFKSIKDYIPARANANVGVVIKPNVLDRSKAKLVSASVSQPEYETSASMYVITGSSGGAYDSPFSASTDYTYNILGPSGSSLRIVDDESPTFNGELSGSLIIAATQNLNLGNTFKKVSGKQLLFNVGIFDSSFDCAFTVGLFVAPSVTPSVTPTISVTPSETPAVSVTPSVTPTISVTPSVTPTISITPTVTPSSTPSVSVTPSSTPSISVTPSSTPSTSVTPSITPTTTPSPTPSETPGVSSTPSTSVTPSISISRTPSVSVTPSISVSRTPSISVTPSRTPSISVTPSRTPSNTPPVSPSRTPSTSVTPSISISKTPSISVTPSISISNTPSVSVTPSKSTAVTRYSITLGTGNTKSVACAETSTVTAWFNNSDPSNDWYNRTDGMYTSSTGSFRHGSAYYSDSLRVRFWTGAGWTGTAELCTF